MPSPLDAGSFLTFGLFGLLSMAGFVFWIVKIVEVARIPEHQYRAAGTEKLTWLLVVALAQAIGALIWHFARRRDVLAAAGPGAVGASRLVPGRARRWAPVVGRKRVDEPPSPTPDPLDQIRPPRTR